MQAHRTGRFLSAAMLVLPLAIAGRAPAEEPKPRADLPTGEQLMEEYLKATGGREAYEKLENSVMEGSMELPGGIKGTLVMYAAKPNLANGTLDLPAFGKSRQGCDGQTVWSIDMNGARILEGEERERMLRHSRFNADLHYKDIYDKLETVGEEKVEGVDCYKVVRSPKAGRPDTAYFDKDSKLIVKMVSTFVGPNGEIEVENFISDYRETDGIRFPHSAVQRAMNIEQRMTLDKIDFNVELPPDTFALPPEIQALKAGNSPAPTPGASPTSPTGSE